MHKILRILLVILLVAVGIGCWINWEFITKDTNLVLAFLCFAVAAAIESIPNNKK